MYRKAVLYIGVIFILIETILHVFCFQKLRIRHFPQVYKIDTNLGYKYIPGASDHHTSPAYYNEAFSINSYGFNDDEFDVEKKSGYFRLIFFDMSFGVDSDKPNNYVRQLREIVNRDGHKIEIINCSVDGGQRDVQRIKMLTDEILEYYPDMVFFNTRLPLISKVEYRSPYKNFMIFFHDLSQLNTIKHYIDETHYKPSILNVMYKYLFSFRYICKYYSENTNNFTRALSKIKLLKNKKRITELVTQELDYRDARFINYYNISESYNLLKNLCDSINSRNSELVIYDTDRFSSINEYFVKSLGAKYLGVCSEFDSESTFGILDGHPTSKGAKDIANALYTGLINNGLIPDEYINSRAAAIVSNNVEDSTESIITSGLNNFIAQDKMITDDRGNTNILFINIDSKVTNEYIKNCIHSRSIDILREKFEIRGFNTKLTDIMVDSSSIEELLQNTNKQIIEHDAKIVAMHLPMAQVKENPPKTLQLIAEYNEYLKKNGKSLLFLYEYDDYDVFENSTSEKFIIDYFMSEYSIRCIPSRVNLMSISNPGEFTSPEDMLTQKIYTQAHNLFEGIRESMIENNIISDTFNLAFNKPVQSSSSISSVAFNEVAVTDNINKSFFSWSYGWLSDTVNAQFDHDEWVSIDLQKNCNVNRVVIYPVSREGLVSYGFPIDFEIQLSDNGQSWTTVKKVIDYALPDYAKAQIFEVDSQTARYVKLVGTKLRKNKYPEGELYRMAIAEVEVY